MAPRGQRQAAGQLRPHSRSSSTSRVGANLQLTQKDPSSAKHNEKSRKNGHSYDLHNKPTAGTSRASNNPRTHSRENIHYLPAKRSLSSKSNGAPKPNTDFTIASNGEQDDDDEWVSSESGVDSPNHVVNPHSDSELDARVIVQRLHQLKLPSEEPDEARVAQVERPETPPARAETPRPSQLLASATGYVAWDSTASRPREEALSLSMQSPSQSDAEHEEQPQFQRAASSETMKDPGLRSTQPPSPSSRHNLQASKRHSRPPSIHSLSSRTDSSLRPHPLIRGNSFSTISHIPKPTPLAPLTVIPDASTNTTSPEQIYHVSNEVSISPSSMISPSPDAASSQRRTSISSTRSVSTLPGTFPAEVLRIAHDRTRALSALHTSSSSAALSSLTHLPTVTRPPSPKAIAFFPPMNPHANIEGIHPLLPSPYMNNHMTVLARRTPLRESYDRVIRAKLGQR
ncbi:hypothetical protein AX17_005828 [Amanita inopinata Kibby_2008]|nr:hypothetical protein AX17_005828 [Amanita inopinata Kibby_2008]